MNLIEHIIDPSRLLLAWQPPEGTAHRHRHHVGEIFTREDKVVFRYLKDQPAIEEAKAAGFEGFPAFNMKTSEHTDGVLDAFLTRVPPSSRTDFPEYLRRHRLPHVELSALALLGYTGASLPRDGFSIVNPFENANAPCELLLEVAGYRHYMDRLPAPPSLGDTVTFRPEPDNEHDSDAVRICLGESVLGYVCRGQTGAVKRWLEQGRVDACIERLNGRPDRPLVYVFVRVRAA